MKHKSVLFLLAIPLMVTACQNDFTSSISHSSIDSDPFTITITPGNISDLPNYSELEIDESRFNQNIENLKVGENRVAGILCLKRNESTNGRFTFGIEDKTTVVKKETDPKLLDYINVYIYDGLAEGDVYTNTLLAKIDVETISNQGKKTVSVDFDEIYENPLITVVINLDASAINYVAQMSNDIVCMNYEWKQK